MAYRTYEEWSARGRAVLKGEKAAGFLTDGTAIFGKEQTTKRPSYPPSRSSGYGGDYTDRQDTWYMGGPDEYY